MSLRALWNRWDTFKLEEGISQVICNLLFRTTISNLYWIIATEKRNKHGYMRKKEKNLCKRFSCHLFWRFWWGKYQTYDSLEYVKLWMRIWYVCSCLYLLATTRAVIDVPRGKKKMWKKVSATDVLHWKHALSLISFFLPIPGKPLDCSDSKRNRLIS